MWNTTGVPLGLVVLVAGVVLLFSQLGSIRFWRYLDDATTPGQEHAGLTRQEAVSGAVARVEGYLRHHRLPGGRILLVRAEPIDGRVQWWCKGCVHWQVELAMGDERFCIALTEDFAAFSNGCARWHPHAAPPPAALVAAARPVRVQTPSGSGGLLLQRRIGRTADLYVLDVTTGRLRRLTRTSRHEFSPVWSPDRRRIAFAVNLGGSELDVYTMRADGSEVARVTSSAGPDEEPTWLPDGRLAYSSVRDGIGSIYVREWTVVHAFLPLAPLVIDEVLTMLRRLSRGERPWVAHRSHVYQRLAQGGWPHRRVALLYGLLSLPGAAIALALGGAPATFILSSVWYLVVTLTVLVLLGHGSDRRPARQRSGSAQ